MAPLYAVSFVMKSAKSSCLNRLALDWLALMSSSKLSFKKLTSFYAFLFKLSVRIQGLTVYSASLSLCFCINSLRSDWVGFFLLLEVERLLTLYFVFNFFSVALFIALSSSSLFSYISPGLDFSSSSLMFCLVSSVSNNLAFWMCPGFFPSSSSF